MVASLAFGFIDQYMSQIAIPSMPNEDIWIARFPNVSSTHRRIWWGPAVSSCALTLRSSASEIEPRTEPRFGALVVVVCAAVLSAAVVVGMCA